MQNMAHFDWRVALVPQVGWNIREFQQCEGTNSTISVPPTSPRPRVRFARQHGQHFRSTFISSLALIVPSCARARALSLSFLPSLSVERAAALCGATINRRRPPSCHRHRPAAQSDRFRASAAVAPREICAGERSNRRRRRGALWLDLGASGRGMLLLLLLLLFPVLFLFASSCRCSGSE